MASEDVKLLPCPFCGNATAPVVTMWDREPPVHGYYVVCDASGPDEREGRGCGCGGCWGEDEAAAIRAWNRRAAQPVATAAPADRERVRIAALEEAVRAISAVQYPVTSWRCVDAVLALRDKSPPAPQPGAAPDDRNAILSEIEDMHERAWSLECERGNLDRAEWHRECAGQMRAMKGERP